MARPLVDSRARDVRRRVEVIQKKLADLRQLGVICAFTYTSVRNTGSFFTLGDQRFTDVIECHKDEIVQNLLNPKLAPCGGLAWGEVHLILPLLPAPLEQLSRRALQSLLVGILKDLGIRWSDPRPEWWPLDVPFVPSCSTPDDFSGNWTEVLQRIIKSVYSHFSYDITTYVASIMQDCSASIVGDPSTPGSPDTPSGMIPSACAESVADPSVPLASETHSSNKDCTSDTVAGQTAVRDIFRGNHTNTPTSSAQMILTKDEVVGLKGYPITRSHPPVQYTKFTVVSASSIASPRKRLARVQVDSVPIGKNRLLLQVQPQSAPLPAPTLPRQLAPRTLVTSVPTSVSTPSLAPAKPPQCIVSIPPVAAQPSPSLPPPPPPPPLPPFPSKVSCDQQYSSLITPKTLLAQTKPLVVKDASRQSSSLFGRLDFTMQSQGAGSGKRPSPVKGVEQGAGQRTNKLHFHMMTVVNKAKRTALINKGRELHRMLTVTTDVPAGRHVPEQDSKEGGGARQMCHHSLSHRGSVIGSTELKHDHKGSSDAPSPVAGASENKEVGSHHVRTTPPCADTHGGVRRHRRGRQSMEMSTGSAGRRGGSGTPGSQKVLTFHVYEDPITAFKVKRSRQD